MSQVLEPVELTSGSVTFELEQLRRVAGGQLEVIGRWYGVRGRRFVRPTLTYELDDQPGRALADLEHKPWSPEDGQSWIATFPWSDDGEISALELAVAPDISVALPWQGKGRRRRRRASAAAPPVPATPSPSAEERAAAATIEQLQRDLAEARAENKRLRAAVEQAGADVEGARDLLRDGLREAQLERDRARYALERAIEERDQAVRARDAAARERDQALLARSQAESLQQELSHAAQSVAAQRDAARALATRRRLSWHRSSPYTVAGSRAARHGSWAVRSLAVVLLVAFVIVFLLAARLI